jgi:hypothetical protein
LDHASKFRFDRRLQHRRGWISSDVVDKEVASLPDVTEKAEAIDSPQYKGAGNAPQEGAGD